MTFSLAPGHPHVVTGMQQDMAYEVRVAARTAAGAGEYSNAKVERTKKWVATAAPIFNKGDHLHLRQWMLTVLIAALLSVNLCI